MTESETQKTNSRAEEGRKEARRSALSNLFILFVIGASGVVTAFIAPAFGGIGWQLVGGIALWMTLFAVLMLASHLVMYLLGAGVYD